MMADNEQWLSTGDCSLCRRQKYCSKSCKAAKNRKQAQIAGAMANIMYDVLVRAANRSMDMKGVKQMIKSATHTSVYDGDGAITSNCKVNLETKEVFDIEPVEIHDFDFDHLDREYVTIDGEEYPVSKNGEKGTEYWYR